LGWLSADKDLEIVTLSRPRQILLPSRPVLRPSLAPEISMISGGLLMEDL
jgi:hypothetical protein